MKTKQQLMMIGLVLFTIIIPGSVAYSLLDHMPADMEEQNDKEDTTGDHNDQDSTNETNDGITLEFSIDCCGDSDVDAYNRSQHGIQEVIWIDETTVQIIAGVSINCAAWIEGAGYRIHNNTIVLMYYVGKGPCLTYCSCGHSLRFTLSNLEPGDYEFELESVYNDYSDGFDLDFLDLIN